MQIGYQNTLVKFWWFALTIVLVDNCGASLGMFVACLFNELSVALVGGVCFMAMWNVLRVAHISDRHNFVSGFKNKVSIPRHLQQTPCL